MTKIRFISQEGLETIKGNLYEVRPFFCDEDSSWIQKRFGDVYINSKYEMPDISLNMDSDTPFATESANVKLIYSALKIIPDTHASDERLWAGICLTVFWKYVQYRWKIKEKCTVNNIKHHFFFDFGPRRSLTRNALSRLWWIGRLTYDEARKNPYELTDFVCKNADFIFHILERNTSNNKMLVKGFLQGVFDAQKEGLNINTNTVAELARYLNQLGGVYILDCLSEDAINIKILARARKICV